MVKIVNGDLLKCREDIICHQVNCQGSMGGGVARQLALQIPELEKEYYEYCMVNDFDYYKLRGRVHFFRHINIIANCFSQKPNFDTDYEELSICFKKIKSYAKRNNLSIAMPYNMGCGIADGNWEEVEQIILDIFTDYDVTLYRLHK